MPRTKAKEAASAAKILTALRVRPGFQRTTHVLSDYPFACVDFWYDHDGKVFALTLYWPVGNSRTVYVSGDEVITGNGRWAADCTYRLSEACIDRIAPGLQGAIDHVIAITRDMRESEGA